MSLEEMQRRLPVTVFADANELGKALAREIAQGVEQAASAGRRYLLGCPGGRTPRTTYLALGRLAQQRRMDLSRLVIAMMDDYIEPRREGFVACPAEAHYSCRRFAKVEIQGVLNAGLDPAVRVRDEHVWGPDPADPASYDVKLRDAGGIDLFILASGASDGHVAFNPPGTPADSITRHIRLADTTRRDNLQTFPDFCGLDEVPLYGVSVGLGTIASLSRLAVLLLHGEGKQDAVRQLAACSGFSAHWPASIIHRCNNPAIYLDRAARGV